MCIALHQVALQLHHVSLHGTICVHYVLTSALLPQVMFPSLDEMSDQLLKLLQAESFFACSRGWCSRLLRQVLQCLKAERLMSRIAIVHIPDHQLTLMWKHIMARLEKVGVRQD